MALVAFPQQRLYQPRRFELTVQRRFFESPNPYSSASQSAEAAGTAIWTASLDYGPTGVQSAADMANIEGFWARFANRVDRLQLWHLRRAVPAGTMRGSPTIQTWTAQFSRTIPIQTTAGATLLPGDMLGIAGQLVRVVVGGTADGTGLISSVSIDPPLRAAVSGGTAVVWDKPTANFAIASDSMSFSFSPGQMNEFAVSLVEYP